MPTHPHSNTLVHANVSTRPRFRICFPPYLVHPFSGCQTGKDSAAFVFYLGLSPSLLLHFSSVFLIRHFFYSAIRQLETTHNSPPTSSTAQLKQSQPQTTQIPSHRRRTPPSPKTPFPTNIHSLALLETDFTLFFPSNTPNLSSIHRLYQPFLP
jgi:hypothetical protein